MVSYSLQWESYITQELFSLMLIQNSHYKKVLLGTKGVALGNLGKWSWDTVRLTTKRNRKKKCT